MVPLASLLFVIILLWSTSSAKATYNTIGTYPPARLNEVGTAQPEPEFGDDIQNVTVALGREAILSCIVDNLGEYRVGWMRADTQTILSLHKKVITHNTRISVTHNEPRTWNLHIRMSTVPPNIIDEQTSGDITVPDGESVSLICTANGYPKPKILWRREDGDKITLRTGRRDRMKVDEVEGSSLNLTRVRRKQMGAYVCIAKNEVPPAVMKRIIVNVSFEPTVHVPNQLVGTPLASDLFLSCKVEAYPKPITFWRKNNDFMILNGPKYKVSESTKSYHTNMSLVIRDVQDSDIGTYTCVARNSISQAEGQIRTYEIDPPATNRPTTDKDAFGSDVLSTALDHSAKSSGLHKNQFEDDHKASVATSNASHTKGKRKDLHHYNLEAGDVSKNAQLPSVPTSSATTKEETSMLHAIPFVYFAFHLAHIF
ncbi:lachesin-like [Panulirus ornatus]|uniref:lachesin-like n=1 Tax=Panulirus ornatus TaxID=150431 RepID=UPI003A848BAB